MPELVKGLVVSNYCQAVWLEVGRVEDTLFPVTTGLTV